MATVTKWKVSAPQHINTKDGIGRCVVDFGETSASSGDVIQLFEVDADYFGKEVRWYTLTGEGGTCTGTIGDGTAADGYDASADIETAANNGTTLEATDSVAGGRFYASADTVIFTLSNDASTAKVVFYLVGHSTGQDLA